MVQRGWAGPFVKEKHSRLAARPETAPRVSQPSGAQYGRPPHNLTRTERILRDNGSLGASPGVPASRTLDRFLTRMSGTVAGSVGPAVPGS